MKTQRAIIPKSLNVTVKGNGTSLWGESNGNYKIKKMELNYLNLVAYPDEKKLYASVDVFGDSIMWHQYTDKQIEKNINNSEIIKNSIEMMINNLLKHNNINRQCKASNLKISWSEQGLQPYDGWNFDISEIMN